MCLHTYGKISGPVNTVNKHFSGRSLYYVCETEKNCAKTLGDIHYRELKILSKKPIESKRKLFYRFIRMLRPRDWIIPMSGQTFCEALGCFFLNTCVAHFQKNVNKNVY